MDIGSLMAGGSSDGAAPGLEDQWNSYLKSPETRAALLGFGLSLMSGGWGNPAQQIAQGIGQGVEAGAQVGTNIQKEADSNQARQDRLDTQQLNATLEREKMANQRDIAGIYSNNRLDVANIRAGALPANQIETKKYWDTYNLVTQQALPGEDPNEVAARAKAAADNALAAHRAQFGTPSANGSSGLNGQGPGSPTSPGTTPAPSIGGQNNQPNTPTITLKDGRKARLSPDGKSWIPY